MSSVAPVNFKHVVEDFNQSGWPRTYYGNNLDKNTANFGNVQMTLENVRWHDASPEVKGLRLMKNVNVNAPGNTNTKVTAYAVPGSCVNIVSGYMEGVPSTQATSTILLPEAFGSNIQMYLDLTKSQQVVLVPDRPRSEVAIKGSGAASVKSKPTVFQGNFEADASFKGGVTFRTTDGATAQVSIELMAKEANKEDTLRQPFYYSQNALCWRVLGNMDLIVENLDLVKS